MSRSADFPKVVKNMLAAKVGYHCSNPFCRISTIGAKADGSGTLCVGEAAHITAASPGGPRYDASLSIEQRKSETNGIWLCRTHAAMIDRDEKFFTVDMLLRWKAEAEKEANERLQGIAPSEKSLYALRALLDDLMVCTETINLLEASNSVVVIPASKFPVTNEYEEKIEAMVDSIGMKYASRMRSAFRDISDFKNALSNEEHRFNNRIGRMMDAQAVKYDYELRDFLRRMQKYDLNECIIKLEQLFE